MNKNNRPRVVWKDGKCVICNHSNNAQKKPVPQEQVKPELQKNDNVIKKAKASAVSDKQKKQAISYGKFGSRSSNKSIYVYIFVIVVLLSLIVFGAALLAKGPTQGGASQSNKEDLIEAYLNGERSEQEGKYYSEPKFKDSGYAVCIDPGHGFSDVGAYNGQYGVYESEIALNVALKLRDKLKSQGIKVYMTRDTNELPQGEDEYRLGLSERNNYANSTNGIDFFMSIHCDSFQSDVSIKGARVYYMDYDEKAKAMSDIFAELYEPDEEKRKNTVKPKKRNDPYQILIDSAMPAVLFETGYLSNEEDAKAMLTDKWVNDTAELIAQTVINGFENGIIG